MLNSILLILFLIAVSAFFSLSEISLAASRKIKLKLLADEGDTNALRVLKLQETPGMFFTVVQIGLNAVAILVVLSVMPLSPLRSNSFLSVLWLLSWPIKPVSFVLSC